MLIRPFLNDKAKGLITQLEPTITADYEKLKEAMLWEFQLSPAKYLERFNTYKKPETETYVMYASKLSALLNYYIDSRCIKTLAQPRELLICDRVKLSLPDACLRHVVAVESADFPSKLGRLSRIPDPIRMSHFSVSSCAVAWPISRSPGQRSYSRTRVHRKFELLKR